MTLKSMSYSCLIYDLLCLDHVTCITEMHKTVYKCVLDFDLYHHTGAWTLESVAMESNKTFQGTQAPNINEC